MHQYKVSPYMIECRGLKDGIACEIFHRNFHDAQDIQVGCSEANEAIDK